MIIYLFPYLLAGLVDIIANHTLILFRVCPDCGDCYLRQLLYDFLSYYWFYKTLYIFVPRLKIQQWRRVPTSSNP